MTVDNDKTLGLEFWNRNPVHIKEEQTPRELNDRDIMALKYAAEELLANKFLLYVDGFLTREQVTKSCSVCNKKLYVGDFIGYKLSDTEVLRSLFFNENDRLIAEVWTSEDDYEHYMVY